MSFSKKTLALLTAFIMAFTLLGGAYGVCAGAASAAVPTVYVVAGMWGLCDGEGNSVTDFSLPDGFVEDAVRKCMPSFMRAVMFPTDENVNEYAEKLSSAMAPIYVKAQFDENGDPKDDSGPPFDPSAPASPGEYGFYLFQYDWRRDPREEAENLDTFIDNVRSSTGSGKVNLLGRCEGVCYAMAYLSAYGAEKINRLFFFNSAFLGLVTVNAPFTGNVSIDAGTARDWVDEAINGEVPDIAINSLDIVKQPYWLVLKALIRAVSESYGLDIAAKAVSALFDRMFRPALRETMLTGYATWPGIWSMVFEEDTEKAISYIFEGKEEKYAGLIEKIRGYNRDVRSGAVEMLKAIKAQGVEIGVLSKYGYATDPITENSEQLSDGKALLTHSSFGATTGNFGEPLSDAYLAEARANGNGKYISPDRLIDASTCLFPDSTWLIGNMHHQNTDVFPDEFAYRYFSGAAPMTVDSDPAYPQYLLYIGGTVVPMTEENQSQSLSRPERHGFLTALRELIVQIYRYVKALAESLPERLKNALARE
ncbi:MAG: hypothetical protein IJM45_09855 [Clostridia bacterium]|nr:hypothetical protein [Clostridia bacterium]